MIKISNDVLERLLEKEEGLKDKVIMEIITNYSPIQMAREIILLKLNNYITADKIELTKAEYNRLMSVIKIKGVREIKPSGEFVYETRGRQTTEQIEQPTQE